MGKTYIILDCNYLCHRAKWAMGDLSIDNIPTGVIYGFLKDLITFSQKFDSKDFIFCWDSKYSLRQEVYPAYKQNRRDKEKTKEEIVYDKEFRKQMKKLRREYLPEIGFNNIFIQHGYESDDMIASACCQVGPFDDAIIITADQDLYQCIDPKISVYNPQKRKLLTFQGFKKQYGIFPKQWAMVKVIAGCHSDNIKGCKGIGEKTALKYEQHVLNTESKAYYKIGNFLSTEKALKNAFLINLPMEKTKNVFFEPDEFSNEGWRNVCKKLGMKSIINKCPFGDRR